MRVAAKAFVKTVVARQRGLDPVWEFGSLQVKGQEHFADLRPLFGDRPYVGCDMRPGRGVDRLLRIHQMPEVGAETVGTAICVDTLEHVIDPASAADELCRVLKPGGLLLVTSCFRFPIHSHPSDYWRFTPEAIAILFEPLEEWHGSWDGPDVVDNFDRSSTDVDPIGVYLWGRK